MKNTDFEINTIGKINRKDHRIELKILEKYRDGLLQLDKFSHMIVVWWAGKYPEYRKVLQSRPPYAPDKLTGVFATRSPVRPNPIAITTCKILNINKKTGTIIIQNIDADDGTEILDLKPYTPVLDKIDISKVPDWLPEEIKESFPDEGIGLDT